MIAPPRFVVNTLLSARKRLQRAADAMVPAEVALLERSFALATTQIMGVVAELGIPDLLAHGPKTAADLATEVDADADTLHRVLRAAAAIDLVTLDRSGRFRLTRLAQPLRSDHPQSVRSWPRYMTLPSTYTAWGDLLTSVRTGRSAFPRVHGHSVWHHYASHPEEGTLFNDVMRRFTERDVPAIVSSYPWPQYGTICDVAGGVGTLLAGILAANPGLRGILVDSPEVLADADRHLTEIGLRDRIELSPGDIFSEISAPADIYLIKDVLHDWDDDACARILNVVRGPAVVGAKVLLIEAPHEKNEVHPIVSIMDLQMLTQCDDGRQRAVGEWQSLLAGAGFRPGPVYRTPGLESVIEGVAR